MKNCIKIKKIRLKLLKKCHFQLLEIMIASFLIVLCAAPALRIYTNTYLHQQQIIRENQRDHLAHAIHMFIVEQLYKKAIASSEVLEGKNEVEISEPHLSAQLQKINYSAYYQFENPKKRTRKVKETKNSLVQDAKITDYLVTLKITLHDEKSLFPSDQPLDMTYLYFVYIMTSDNEENLQTMIDEESLPIENEENVEANTGLLFK